MATTVADLKVKFSADGAGAVKKEIQGVGNAVDGADKKGRGFMSTMLGTAGGVVGAGMFTGMIGGLKDLGLGFLGANADMEMYMSQLEVATGSTENATKVFDNMKQLAAATPFEFPELVNAARLLESFGQSSEKWIPVIGDTAAATGKGIDQVTEALLDAQTGEFERLKELGIRTRVEGDKVRFSYMKNGQEMVVETENNSQAISDALMGIWDENYDGAMEKMSDTFTGKLSTLKDNVNMLAQDMTKPLFNLAKVGLGLANDWFTAFDSFRAAGVSPLGAAFQALEHVIHKTFGPNAAKAFHSFRVTLQKVFDVIGKAADIIGDGLGKAFDFLGDHMDKVLPALKGIGIAFAALAGWGILTGVFAAIGAALALILSPIGLLIAAAALLGIAWSKNWFDIQGKTAAVVDWLTGTAWPLIQDGIENVKTGIAALKLAWETDFKGIRTTVETLFAALETAWDWFTDTALPVIVEFARRFVEGFQNIVAAIGPTAAAIWTVVSAIADGLGTVWDTVSGPLGTLGGWIADFARWAWDAGTAVVDFVAKLAGDLAGAWDTISGKVNGIKDWIVTVAGKFADAVTAVGNFYDAVITKVGEIWTNLEAKVSKFRSFISDVATRFDTAVTAVGDFYDAVINKIGTLWENISAKVSKFRSFISDVKTRFDEAVTGVTNFYDTVTEKIGGIWDSVSGGIQPFIDGLQKIVDTLNAIVDAAGKAKDALDDVIPGGGDTHKPGNTPGSGGDHTFDFGNNPLDNLGRPGPGHADLSIDLTGPTAALAAFRQLLAATRDAVVGFVADTIGVMGGWQGGMAAIVTGAMTPFRATISSGTSTGKQSFVTFVADVIGVMGGWSGGLAAIVSGALSAFRSQISSGTSTGKQSFVTFVADTVAVMGGWSGGMRNIVSGAMTAMTGAARSGAQAMASALRSGANDGASGVQGALSRIPGIVAGVGGTAASIAYGVGANIGNAMASGMVSALGAIQGAAAQMVAAAQAALVAKAMIQSPSKLFMGLGEYIGEGFEQGIRNTLPAVAAATAALVGTPGALGATLAPAYAGAGATQQTNYITVSGVSDPDAAARRVLELLIDAQARTR